MEKSNNIPAKRREDLQKFLEGKLEVLKRIFKQGHDLKVLWLPKQHRLVELGGERYLLSGEVVGSNIRIY